MSCKSCSSGGCGSVSKVDSSGCGSSGGCSSGGCSKLNVYDWLSHLDVPLKDRFNIIEVKFKGGRKEYFRNTNNLELYSGDFVACEMSVGYHIGTVSLQGELVRLQMLKKNVKENTDLKSILRKATEKDMEKHEQAVNRDIKTMYKTREISSMLKLNMKLSDVEFQSDNAKATFYYTADDRVDFRELIKLLAGEFKVRVEMKQISLRQEASRVGGIGSCGRELCCSTWLTDYKNIPTSAARYQSLSLNPAKLSGQCGRLKCCLNFELDTYVEALNFIPQIDKSLQTQKGEAILQKTDIFRKLMWFSYGRDINWHMVPTTRVVEIQNLNKQQLKPRSLEDLETSTEEEKKDKTEPINTDLMRLDKKYTDKKRFNNKNKPERTFDKSKPARPNQNEAKIKTDSPTPVQPLSNADKPLSSEKPAFKKNKNKFRNKNRPNPGKAPEA